MRDLGKTGGEVSSRAVDLSSKGPPDRHRQKLMRDDCVSSLNGPTCPSYPTPVQS